MSTSKEENWSEIQYATENDDFIDPLSNGEDTAVPNAYFVNVDEEDDANAAIIETINNVHTPRLEKQVDIMVSDPQKQANQQGAYIAYLVISEKNQVRRRFQDFVWLHNMLYINYSACFIPPLPDKHLLGYVKGDRFSPEFTEKRRICLERFLQRIAKHPILCKSSAFTTFLESSNFNDKAAKENVMDTISDSLLNVFSKIRKPDQRFTDMKERTDIMEGQLDVLQKTLLRTDKRTTDLYLDYKELSQSACTLTVIDDSYKPILDDFIPALDEYTTTMKQVLMEDTKWQLGIHDYMSYCRSIKDVLKLRDQKQLDFEELSEYLKSTSAQRQDTVHGRLGDGGVVAYITAKLLEVTGSNPNRIRRARVSQLDEQIRELEEAVKQTHEISTKFSNQVLKEDVLFKEIKNEELCSAMKSYTKAKVDFYQNGLNIWEELLQKLENK